MIAIHPKWNCQPSAPKKHLSKTSVAHNRQAPKKTHKRKLSFMVKGSASRTCPPAKEPDRPGPTAGPGAGKQRSIHKGGLRSNSFVANFSKYSAASVILKGSSPDIKDKGLMVTLKAYQVPEQTVFLQDGKRNHPAKTIPVQWFSLSELKKEHTFQSELKLGFK